MKVHAFGKSAWAYTSRSQEAGDFLRETASMRGLGHLVGKKEEKL